MAMKTASQEAGAEPASNEVSGGAEWTRAERRWIGVVAFLFSSTGSLKLYAGLTGQGTREATEKVFQIPMEDWSLIAGTLELIWVALLVASPGPRIALRIVRFLFAAILAYRAVFHAFDGGYCGCLGGLLSNSPWQSQEGLLLGSVALAGLLVNEALLARRRRQGGVASAGWLGMIRHRAVRGRETTDGTEAGGRQ